MESCCGSSENQGQPSDPYLWLNRHHRLLPRESSCGFPEQLENLSCGVGVFTGRSVGPGAGLCSLVVVSLRAQ